MFINITDNRGIITCALRFSVFFTVPLFDDPTWYASGGPMIYALVEPSIYMIASILPTTRHLYRRVCRNARQLRNTRGGGNGSGGGNGGSNTKTSGGHSQPAAELERIGNSGGTSNRGITRRVDIWQTNANESEEELTLGEWDHSGQADVSSPSTPKAHSFVSSKITKD